MRSGGSLAGDDPRWRPRVKFRGAFSAEAPSTRSRESLEGHRLSPSLGSLVRRGFVGWILLLVSCRVPRQEVESPPKVNPSPLTPLAVEIDMLLPDQLGGVHWVRTRGGAILILSDRDSVEDATRWDLEVVRPSGAVGRTPIHRVIDLSGIPNWALSIAKSSVRRSAKPPDTPLLLDAAGRVRTALGEAPGRACLIVVDRASRVLLRREGRPEPRADISRLRGALATFSEDPIASKPSDR
jgi:hypothetical protein